MTQQIINVGLAPNDGLGDPARTAFQKTNANFTELYATALPSGASYADTFTGNGVQTAFTLSANPGSINALSVSVDGSTFVPGTDYTWTGTTLTLTVAPKTGQTLLARYSVYVGSSPVITPGSVDTAALAAQAVTTAKIATGAVTASQLGASAVTASALAASSVVDTSLASTSQIYAVNQTYNRTAAEISAGVTPTNYGYAPGDVRRYGADPTGVSDSTTAIQNAVNVCSNNSQYGGGKVYIPAGNYIVSSTITLPKTYLTITGDGAYTSRISANGVTGAVLKFASMSYCRPRFDGFSIVGNSSTGHAIDMSQISGSCYDGYFQNLYLYVGGKCIYFPGANSLFSFKFDSIIGTSLNDHVFHVNCGPGSCWINCYAENCPAGKCGYRIAGYIYMYSCNGVNTADYWGVFGNDTTASDGFQTDFSFISYPSVEMYNCNVENFTTMGLYLHASIKSFRFRGGSFVKGGSAAYNSIVTFRSGNAANAVAELSPGIVILGTGVPNGGGALTNAYVRAMQPMTIMELSGQFIAAGVSGFYADIISNVYPWATFYPQSDVYADTAIAFNAIYPRRLSVQMLRYATPAALTPVGAAQAINVTGYTKVTVTPAAAASISTATFTTTTGVGSDFGRNGDLIIEAGNGNLTVNHSASGANTFRMAGAANVTMTTGQVLRFCWSTTSSQWIQV